MNKQFEMVKALKPMIKEINEQVAPRLKRVEDVQPMNEIVVVKLAEAFHKGYELCEKEMTK